MHVTRSARSLWQFDFHFWRVVVPQIGAKAWGQVAKPLGIGLFFACSAAVGGMPALKPEPVFAAERITAYVGPLEFAISLESLINFAETGEVDGDLALLTRRLGPQATATLRQLLQKRFDFNVVLVDRVARYQSIDGLLKRLGEVIQPVPDVNGAYALRAALILAAADRSEGLTPVNVIHHFPGKAIRLNTSLLLQLLQQVKAVPRDRAAMVQAVSQEAATEAAAQPIDGSKLPDLSQPGAYRVTKQTLTIPITGFRQTPAGFVGSYNLLLDVYTPEGLTQPAPLVVVTHGFGSNRDSYGYIARHLASHGIVTAAPEHIGSNLAYRQAYLQGELSVDISPLEFIDRNVDITNTIDALEQRVTHDPAWAKLINLKQIGILGNSFGGTTVLSAVGATINTARLRQECTPDKHLINFSVLLQCRGSLLPPQNYTIADPRIKAAFAAYPLTSVVFGPEGLGQVSVPTLIMAGSRDVFTPVLEEQIHPFVWLGSQDKYLAVLINGTHFSTAEDAVSAKLPEILRSPRPDLGRAYFQALSVAFFKVHLAQQDEYRPYLTAAYADALSQAPLKMKLVRSLTASQLRAAYGGEPPEPIVPPSAIAPPPPQRPEPILQTIRRTGVLNVALRPDAAPVSAVTADDHWTGYCAAITDALAAYLSETTLLPTKVTVVRWRSTLENRFQLVQNNTVHLECGPDTIRTDIKDITFSNPFLVTGTQFLVRQDDTAIKPTRSLERFKLGVLQRSLTEQFLQQTYPKAAIVSFTGQDGRTQAVQALTNGNIDAFVTDGILALGAGSQQTLPTRDRLVPKQPLTCDYYGLVLPQDDAQWQATINAFLRSRTAKQIQSKTFQTFYPTVFTTLDYCLNRIQP